jgi:hypothetical protein
MKKLILFLLLFSGCGDGGLPTLFDQSRPGPNNIISHNGVVSDVEVRGRIVHINFEDGYAMNIPGTVNEANQFIKGKSYRVTVDHYYKTVDVHQNDEVIYLEVPAK